MGSMQRKSLDMPDEERKIPNGGVQIWELGDFVVGRVTFNPGWRWSTDVKPIAGTDWCAGAARSGASTDTPARRCAAA